ncbi:hypothetical protein Nepgr_026133 [Nepenthes gracilis]|uniref:Uncharacterized protein n=1 Tax=Nepenthes gracilis TaxID=150966 RepID=A0AAD3T6D7_NEPGR|nr:hypothetical protein Nepgr_026133 [Nepenthes gracilis]
MPQFGARKYLSLKLDGACGARGCEMERIPLSYGRTLAPRLIGPRGNEPRSDGQTMRESRSHCRFFPHGAVHKNPNILFSRRWKNQGNHRRRRCLTRVHSFGAAPHHLHQG